MSPAVEMLWSLCMLLVLLPVDPADAHTGSPGLLCTNDFVNNVSCSWTRSWVGSAENCWITGVKKYWKFRSRPELIAQSCKLKQHRNSSLGCSFVFEKTAFSGSEVMPFINLTCNGTLVKDIKNYKPADHIKMHPPGAPQVNITANFTLISWTLGSPVSMYFEAAFNFELQVKQREQQWKDSKEFNTKEQELRSPVGKLKGNLEVRVRVKPSHRDKSHWSDWSPTTSWVDLTDKKDWSPDQNSVKWILLPLSLCLLIIVLLAYYKSCKARGLLKGKPLPNPSKYFQTLHSIHQGNLKEWLNPLSGTQSFMVPSCDQIAQVAVCEDWNEMVPSPSPTSSSTSTFLHFHRNSTSCSDSSGVVYNSSSLSSFSNVGYFISSSCSGSARTNPNPAYFTYHDNFQNLPQINGPQFCLCDPLNSFPEYESLKREPESPDSGFGIMTEDEMKETHRVIFREGEEVLNDQSSPLLFLPLHLSSHLPSSPSAHPSTLTQPSESQMDAAETDTSSSSAAQLVAGAMCRSSSMPVEPFKTGYLTLKELQITFSNKSI